MGLPPEMQDPRFSGEALLSDMRGVETATTMETEHTRPPGCFWNKISVLAFGRGCGDCESRMRWLDCSNLMVYFGSAHTVFFLRLFLPLAAQRWGALSNGKPSSP